MSAASRPRRAALLALALVAFLASLLTAGSVRAEERPSITAAMRLAVLVERMAKLQLQAAQGVGLERSRRALGEATREFDATLRALAPRAPAPEARDNYLLLQLLWEEHRGWVARAATRDGARRLADRTDEVAWIAGKGARLMHPGGSDSLAMRAGRVAALSQKAARLALMRRWDAANAELAREAAASLEELRALVTQLAGAPLNTPETAGEVQVAETQLGFLERAAAELGRDAASARHAENVAKTGDHILEVATRLAARYEAAGF